MTNQEIFERQYDYAKNNRGEQATCLIVHPETANLFMRNVTPEDFYKTIELKDGTLYKIQGLRVYRSYDIEKDKIRLVR